MATVGWQSWGDVESTLETSRSFGYLPTRLVRPVQSPLLSGDFASLFICLHFILRDTALVVDSGVILLHSSATYSFSSGKAACKFYRIRILGDSGLEGLSFGIPGTYSALGAFGMKSTIHTQHCFDSMYRVCVVTPRIIVETRPARAAAAERLDSSCIK